MSYKEIFVSPGRYETNEEAMLILDKIREQHSEGWNEINAGVKQDENGKWYAYREHEKVDEKTINVDRDER